MYLHLRVSQKTPFEGKIVNINIAMVCHDFTNTIFSNVCRVEQSNKEEDGQCVLFRSDSLHRSPASQRGRDSEISWSVNQLRSIFDKQNQPTPTDCPKTTPTIELPTQCVPQVTSCKPRTVSSPVTSKPHRPIGPILTPMLGKSRSQRSPTKPVEVRNWNYEPILCHKRVQALTSAGAVSLSDATGNYPVVKPPPLTTMRLSEREEKELYNKPKEGLVKSLTGRFESCSAPSTPYRKPSAGNESYV